MTEAGAAETILEVDVMRVLLPPSGWLTMDVRITTLVPGLDVCMICGVSVLLWMIEVPTAKAV